METPNQPPPQVNLMGQDYNPGPGNEADRMAWHAADHAAAAVLARLQLAANRETIIDLQTALAERTRHLDAAAKIIGAQTGEIARLRDALTLAHEHVAVLQARAAEHAGTDRGDGS